MKRIFLPVFIFSCFVLHAQYAADNVKYTTVYPQDLCKTLQANPGFVLLDVRSQGEFDDTLSNSQELNIGHIKGAMHIDIRQLPSRWKELLPYKEKPLFIYCSHSQRSRRASRLLSDSGFLKIFNVNEGLTGFYIDNLTGNDCQVYSIETHLPYKIVSPSLLDENKVGYFMIDIRSDSTWRGIASSESSNIAGHFDKILHIPLEQLNASLSSVPMNKPLLIVDSYGDNSPKAAALLHDKGYNDLSILFNGMDEWLDYTTYANKKATIKWTPGVNYAIISPDEFLRLTNADPSMPVIDVRTKDEYANQSKNFWQNIGQVKNAVNIPSQDIIQNTATNLPVAKDRPLLIYGFNNNDYIYAAAKALEQAGYKKIFVLRGGIWGLRWSAHNKPGKSAWAAAVVNVPEINQ